MDKNFASLNCVPSCKRLKTNMSNHIQCFLLINDPKSVLLTAATVPVNVSGCVGQPDIDDCTLCTWYYMHILV